MHNPNNPCFFIVNNSVTKSSNKTNGFYYIYEYIKEFYTEATISISDRYSDIYFKFKPLHNNFQVDYGSIRLTDGVNPWKQIPLTEAWSMINKSNGVYSNDEWASILTWASTGDEQARMLALSMLKNSSFLDASLVNLTMTLLSKHEIKEEYKYLSNVVKELYLCKNIQNRDIDLDLATTYIKLLGNNRKEIFNNQSVMDIFTRKYKGVLNIGPISVKK